MKLVSSGIVLTLVLVASTVASARADNPPASAQATVEIAVRLVAQAALPAAWTVLLRPVGAAEEPAARFAAKAAEPLRLQLAPGSSWEVAADLPGFWVPRKTLVAGRAGETSRLALDLWPLGKIAGRVQVSEKGV